MKTLPRTSTTQRSRGRLAKHCGAERKPFVRMGHTNGPPARCDMGLWLGTIQYSTNPPQ